MTIKTATAAVSRRRALLPAALVPGLARNDTAPSLTEVVAKVGDIAKSFEAFKATNDARIAELMKGRDDVVAKEHVERISADIEKHQSQLKELNDKVEAASRAPQRAEDETPQAAEHRKAFSAMLRGDKRAAAGLEDLAIKAALSTDSEQDGGFVVPAEVDRAITRILGMKNGMRNVASVITIGTDRYECYKNLGGGTAGWVGEKDARSQTNTPTLAKQEFPVHEMYAMPASTQKVLDDAYLNIEGWLADEAAINFADKEGDAFINGDGALKPWGLFNATYQKVASSVASPSAWGKIGFTATGNASGFLTPSSSASPADAFITLQESLKPGYLPGASWIMNRATRTLVRQFKDGQGNYLWQAGMGAGIPDTLMGYPIEIDDNVPSVGSGNFPIAFGDFKQGYQIIDRMGTRLIRDNLTSKGYVLFYMTRRVGGGVKDYHAIKMLKCA